MFRASGSFDVIFRIGDAKFETFQAQKLDLCNDDLTKMFMIAKIKAISFSQVRAACCRLLRPLPSARPRLLANPTTTCSTVWPPNLAWTPTAA